MFCGEEASKEKVDNDIGINDYLHDLDIDISNDWLLTEKDIPVHP